MAERVLFVKIDKSAGGPQRLSYSEPIGICYISGYLEKHGIECRLLHIIEQNARHEVMNAFRDFKPTMVGFSVRNFNFNLSCACIKEIRTEMPDVTVCIGGECITWENITSLAETANADLALVSDTEESLFAYLSHQSPDTIPGIAFRDKSGVLVRSVVGPKRVDPKELPMMDRRDLPMASYKAEAFTGKKYATMHTQRGCRYRCTFCHTASRYDGPMTRTDNQIIEEVDFLCGRYQIEALAIWDEDFFADVERVRRLAESLVDRGTPVEWHTFMKLTDLKSPEIRNVLPLLKKSGYKRAVIGLESFIPKTLKHYHKAGGPNIEESLQFLSEQGISVCPSYIIGEPDETERDIVYGLDHLLRLRDRGIIMDLPYVSFITPFPGTPVYQEYSRRNLIIDGNWDHYDGEHVVVKSRCSTERLVELRDKFYREFYGEPAIESTHRMQLR